MHIIRTVFQRLRENILVILTLLWVSLWIFPWVIWFDSFPWIRLWVCIIIFITPGMVVSLFLTRDRFTLLAHISSGLAISVFLVGTLGLIGRVFHLSFEFVKLVFAFIGLIGLLILSQYRLRYKFYKPKNLPIVSIVLLACMIVLGGVVALLYKFGIDDFTYLAYLTNWQHSQSLDFKEVVFGSGGIVEFRFLLSVFPMSLAFFAEVSNLHGLWLLGYYLEPVLVVFALLAAYNLYEDFLSSEHEAIAALLLQFTFLFLRVNAINSGTIFFNRLSHDKAFAAFILAPVFFWAIRYFLQSFTLRSGIFSLFIGLSLTLTHPVILAFCVFIISVYAFTVTIVQKEYKKLVVVLVLLVVILLPQAFLRFVDTPLVSHYIFGSETALQQPGSKSFDLESALNTPNIEGKISPIKGTPFYGSNLKPIKMQISYDDQKNPLQVFFSWLYLWLLGFGFLWSLFKLREKPAAPFIFAISSLILLCAFPYTGWLVGYFVTARMIHRSLWFFPVGLIGVILLSEFLKFISRKLPTGVRWNVLGERMAFNFILVVCFILLGNFSIHRYDVLWTKAVKIDAYKNRMEQLSALGDYLEFRFEQPVVVAASPFGLRPLMDYLPGLSSKSKVIFFRNYQFTIYSMSLEKIQMIFSHSSFISIQQRITILKKYPVDYILVEDPFLKDYYGSYSNRFRVQEFGGFWIIEILERQ